MGKKSIVINWFFLLITLVLGLLILRPAVNVQGNSLPPPSYANFEFIYETNAKPGIEGIQIIGCETRVCYFAELLQQYGVCNQSGCIQSAPTLTDPSSRFECVRTECNSMAYPSHGGTIFKLIVQFSDRVRSSEAINKLPSGLGDERNYFVYVRDSDLLIEEKGTRETVFGRGSVSPFPVNPVVLFTLSIVAEVGIAGFFLYNVRKNEKSLLPKRLLIVFLINLASLPVVWYFFPSLAYLPFSINSVMGFLVLLASVFCSIILWGIYQPERRTRLGVVIPTGLLLIVNLTCIGSFLFRLLSRDSIEFAWGLNAPVIIILSEVYAVSFEALMLYLLSRRTINMKLAWIISLLMNAASFVLGLILTDRIF